MFVDHGKPKHNQAPSSSRTPPTLFVRLPPGKHYHTMHFQIIEKFPSQIHQHLNHSNSTSIPRVCSLQYLTRHYTTAWNSAEGAQKIKKPAVLIQSNQPTCTNNLLSKFEDYVAQAVCSTSVHLCLLNVLK